MQIIIDIGHPAHVHLFKYVARDLQEKGHKILFTCREKEFEIELLKHYGFIYKSFGKKYYSMSGKLLGLFEFSIKEILVGLRFKPDLFLSHGSMYAAYASRILGVPHISLEDTGNMEQIKLYKPFTDVILTPDVLNVELGEKHIRYKGYHELAYLHPTRLKIDEFPDGLNEPYVLLRFVSWGASHDMGQTGISVDQKKELITFLSKKYKVIISAEKELSHEFNAFASSFPPHLMHAVMKNATLFIGEGATMASEAAVMGTPAIYISSIPISYCEDLEKYGLVFNLRTGEGLIEKVNEILCSEDISHHYSRMKNKMIADKIDVTAFLIWFLENYPESMKIMKQNPDYQLRFK